MISRRKFLTGTLLSLGTLVLPWESKVFYSIPKIVVPQNLAPLNLAMYYEFEIRQMGKALVQDINKQMFGIGKYSWEDKNRIRRKI